MFIFIYIISANKFNSRYSVTYCPKFNLQKMEGAMQSASLFFVFVSVVRRPCTSEPSRENPQLL